MKQPKSNPSGKDASPLVPRRKFLSYGAAALAAASTGCATVHSASTESAQKSIMTMPRRPGTPEPLLLTNLRLLDVEQGTCDPVNAVLLRGGRIAEIYRRAMPDFSIEARRVNLNGDVLAPGLIDAHVHSTMPHMLSITGAIFHMTEQIDRNLACFVQGGVTTVRDLGGAPGLLVRRCEAINRGRQLGPNVLRCHSIIQTPGGYPTHLKPLPWPLSDITGQPMIYVISADEGRDAVKKLKDQGADVIKLFADTDPFTLGKKPLPVLDDAILAAIRQQASRSDLPIAVHHSHLAAAARAARLGADTLEHLPIDGIYTDEILRAFEAAGPALIPTITVGVVLAFEMDQKSDDPRVAEAIRFKTDLMANHGHRFLLPRALKESTRVLEKYLTNDFSDRERSEQLFFDGGLFINTLEQGWAKENLRLVRQAGLAVGCGTDAGVPFDYAGNLGFEMEWLSSHGGLTTLEAIQAPTITNARILGLEQSLGSVAQGKTADLVVLAGNPLADIRNYRKIRSVYQGGVKTVERTESSWL